MFSPSSLPPFSYPEDCELIALLEDDTGMELLVCNKIISLDLPVKEVYKKIWCAQPNVSHWPAPSSKLNSSPTSDGSMS